MLQDNTQKEVRNITGKEFALLLILPFYFASVFIEDKVRLLMWQKVVLFILNLIILAPFALVINAFFQLGEFSDSYRYRVLAIISSGYFFIAFSHTVLLIVLLEKAKGTARRWDILIFLFIYALLLLFGII